MDKQELRNSLANIEDRARLRRKQADPFSDTAAIFTLIANFAQLMREEIVK